MIQVSHSKEVSGKITSPDTSLLTLYPAEHHGGEALPFMLVLPGGGYQMRADHEGEPVAKWFNKLGMHAGVLHYRLEDTIDPDSLIQDVEEALSWARDPEDSFGLAMNPNQIGMIGFSAGGHLAAITSVTGKTKPDLLILSYPVITFEEDYTHQGSRSRFLGEDASAEQIASYSADQRVDGRTPPTFLWTTADDGAVPVENSLYFAAALSKAKIPFELHVFESGRHGLGLSEDNESCRQWLDCCANWLHGHRFVRKDMQK
ncbi:alpha/beta hydrolase [Paenibacillus sp. SAF-054]|uniref:alpha/beta hydrolase n=1 Tax=unclassified Paenibacillus TaxID=185978 RepID=UPI003F7E5B1A